MSNFLLDGEIFRFSPAIPFIWAVVQCIAIDANLGVMLVRAVRNFHEYEWVKGVIYLVISLALLFVAAIIFDVEALQSVLNHAVGVLIPIDILTLIRGCAIVALVAAGPLESVSLKIQLRHKAVLTSMPQNPEPDPAEPATGPIVPNYFELTMLVSTLTDLVERAEALSLGTTAEHQVIDQKGAQSELPTSLLDGEAVAASAPTALREVLPFEPAETKSSAKHVAGSHFNVQPRSSGVGSRNKSGEDERHWRAGQELLKLPNEDQEVRLQAALERLKTQGKVTINRLQKEAGVRRDVVSTWLKQQEQSGSV
jgi:hypothetical protein